MEATHVTYNPRKGKLETINEDDDDDDDDDDESPLLQYYFEIQNNLISNFLVILILFQSQDILKCEVKAKLTFFNWALLPCFPKRTSTSSCIS